jgi:hypothetical protein
MVPERSVEQRAAALDRALEVRRERAALRSDLKAARRSGVAVVLGSAADDQWHGVKVIWLLQSLPGVGSVRAEALMSALSIPQTRRLGGLKEQQRLALAEAIAR